MAEPAGEKRSHGLGSALALAGAAIWLSAIWNLPVELYHFGPARLAAVSVEVAAVLAVLALVPALRRGHLGRLASCLIAAASALVLTLKLAELVIRASLARPLNPLLDVHLAPSLVHMLTGTLGPVLGWLALGAVALLVVLALVGSLIAVRAAQRALEARSVRIGTLGAAGLLAVLLGVQILAPAAFSAYRPVSADASLLLADEWQSGRAMIADLAEFERAAATDRFQGLGSDRLLTRLSGVDVLLVYFESYGRSALEDPRYARTTRPRLAAFEQRLAGHGLTAASGYLTSPTAGGQSWLAHGTLESGLWLAHQRHYDLLVRSGRFTLTRALERAGHRTIAVKPAIVRPWPEGERFGFDRIYAAADLGYAGRPYNWVTMPDQYTLFAMERLERVHRARPLFAEVSLISSHAPWTPIPPVLEDWSTVGDGAVFSRWAEAGDPPDVVWRDPERVRHQYARAVDYVLGVLASYAARYVDQRTLLIVVGDHQPSPLITGEGASRDVPMHVISGDPELVRPFLDWGFAPGLQPRADVPVPRMDAFRDRFLETFSQPPESRATGRQ